ncbi:hypothetical protein UA08_03951 [Talaromyces atroroseus]|uniref:Uncharacterized protein n=1 Tax=Talaromyces atroroseus TaxID=1441469 RepID=A0A1Q5Q9H8_TALAT|nr:hypothetical protein UA08_03951 [Talaromyces atroroseus]OKL60679.1 hypothetical protein UA08_03951 [Talaromyces atroroseus]
MSCPAQQGQPSEGFAKERLNTVRVYKQRGRYDYGTVHSITDSTLVSHVAFIIKDEDGEDTPVNLPLTCVLGRYNPSADYSTIDDAQLRTEKNKSLVDGPVEAYLHGNAASLLYKAIKASDENGVRVCITSTKVDGVVLFLTPNGHSLNYRSAVLHGTARLVPNSNAEKKRWAMRLLTNHMWQDRWDGTYSVAQSAIQGVQVIEVSIRTASAKVRAANIGDFDPAIVLGQSPGWQQKAVWSGLVPVYETFGEPVPSGVMDGVETKRAEDELSQVEKWRLERNKQSKTYAEAAAAASSVEQDMRERVEKWNDSLSL